MVRLFWILNMEFMCASGLWGWMLEGALKLMDIGVFESHVGQCVLATFWPNERKCQGSFLFLWRGICDRQRSSISILFHSRSAVVLVTDNTVSFSVILTDFCLILWRQNTFSVSTIILVIWSFKFMLGIGLILAFYYEYAGMFESNWL